MTARSRYLSIWAASLVALLALVAGFNVAIDPYDIFGWRRIPGLNEYKPGIRDHVALTKAYQVQRVRPVTAILGTSRVYYGMDAASPQWPEAYRPVYNYGVPIFEMGDVLLRELRQAWSTGRLRHALVILDLPAFMDPDPPPEPGPDENRLRYLDNGAPNPAWRTQYRKDLLLSMFTSGALVDSVRTVLARNGGDTVSDVRIDGTATPADFADAARAEGMNALFTQKDEYDLSRAAGFSQVLRDWHGPMPNLGLLREAVAFCLEHHISLTLVLGPSHADQLEIYRQAGLWPYVEKLKVDLADLVADAHSDSITAWDFLEYGPYTTEPVPAPGERGRRMHWFWEPIHFQQALGDVMLRRVFDGTPADFGARLSPATVAARNQQVREQQQAFIGWRLACESNPVSPCTLANPVAREASR